MGHLPLSGGCVWLTGAARAIPQWQARDMLPPGKQGMDKLQHWTRHKARGLGVVRLQVDGHQVDGMGWPGLDGSGASSLLPCQVLPTPTYMRERDPPRPPAPPLPPGRWTIEAMRL